MGGGKGEEVGEKGGGRGGGDKGKEMGARGREAWGGGCNQFVHDRRRMTIKPIIPAMPGRGTSGFHQPGRHRLHQARSAVRCSASCMEGKLHALPRTARKTDVRTLVVPTFLLMDDSANEFN